MPPTDLPDLIAHVPVAVHPGGKLIAAGVQVRCGVGHLPEKVYVEIDKALNAKAAASGSNMPVALDPDVWLKRCRRCDAPFIGMPRTRMCSDGCRTLAKQDALARWKAKRKGRRARDGGWSRFVCQQCGKRQAGHRTTKRFCSTACRVAAHRGVAAKPAEPMSDIELARQIDDVRSVLGAFTVIGCDPGAVQRVMEQGVALQAEQAERAKLAP